MKQTPNKELLILSLFREDGRKNLTTISKKTGVPISTLFERLKTYKEGPIKKFTTLLDFKHLGYNFCVTMMLKVDKERREEVISRIINDEHINSAFRINNGYDFMIEGIFKTIGEYEHFIEKLDDLKIKKRQEHYILNEIKREAFLSNPQMIRMEHVCKSNV